MTEALTCEICRHAPAVRVVVIDPPKRKRLQRLACVDHAEWYMRDAVKDGWAAWQFELAPVASEAAVTEGTR